MDLATDKLAEGDKDGALAALLKVVDYPGHLGQDNKLWSQALQLFSRIVEPTAGPEFAQTMLAAAESLGDADVLFYVGTELVGSGLAGFAATVLERANALAPQREELLCELVSALEDEMHFAAAREHLLKAPSLLKSSFLCRYLLAWVTLMCGQLEEARRLFEALGPPNQPELDLLVTTLRQMFERADDMGSSLDLRGWHYVLTGGVLLHVASPSPQARHGRYTWLQDSLANCREGIERLRLVLSAWDRMPAQIWVLPDPDSASLALAAAELWDVPARPWPAGGTSEDGLIAIYDLEALDAPLRNQFSRHHPGQLLWTHASRWTAEAPVAADFTTFLYQVNVSPWGERLGLDPKTGQGVPVPPDSSSPQERAAALCSGVLDAQALADGGQLLELVHSMKNPSAFATSGPRPRQPAGSPVS